MMLKLNDTMVIILVMSLYIILFAYDYFPFEETVILLMMLMSILILKNGDESTSETSE